ncbi:MAG TPA: phosphatase PAP2 family protein [Bacteroidales bacterium]
MMKQQVLNGKLFLLLLLFLPVSLYSQNLDIRILRSINSPETLPSDKFFQLVSNTNAYLVIGLPSAIGTIGLIKHDDKLIRNACVAIAAIAVNAGITEAMKYSINRARPFNTYIDIVKKSPAGSPSFPSGHTSSAFATATTLSLMYPKWYVIVPSICWAGTVGYSRMDLGVHYPSDVLAGALVGAGSAWLTYYVNKKLILKSK